ncbi:MAG: penicillin-binding transpeptidase domain-containing protein, partial [Firmicutes bacterium]|nr:penicillin-binding transpeptidase domain-containing protein [Bacillota bacterium]
VQFADGHGGWYAPHNYAHRWAGPLTMRQAIAQSDNVVAVRWMHQLGPHMVITLARRMGMAGSLPPDLTTALGSADLTPLTMARATTPLANGGYKIVPHAIIRISQHHHIIWQPVFPPVRVLSPQTAYVTTQLFKAPLHDPDGTAHTLSVIFPRPAAGKTGTSSDQRDAWFSGYTPQLLTTVWIGYDNNQPLHGTGGQIAGPIWAHFMAHALNHTPIVRFPAPPHIVWRRICPRTGLLASSHCCPDAYFEVFIRGHVPTHFSPECVMPRSSPPVNAWNWRRWFTTMPHWFFAR